jgi:hypothetical protein
MPQCDDQYTGWIDLGNATVSVDGGVPDWGLNTLQDTAQHNGNVGISLELTLYSPGFPGPVTLLADGNIFDGTNCSTTSAMLSAGLCNDSTKHDWCVNRPGDSIRASQCSP